MDRRSASEGIAKAVTARDWDAAGRYLTDDTRWHAPGIPVEATGREAIVQAVRDFAERVNGRFEHVSTVEHGNMVVECATARGTIEGRPMRWLLVQNALWEGDHIAELWTLRATQPEPDATT